MFFSSLVFAVLPFYSFDGPTLKFPLAKAVEQSIPIPDEPSALTLALVGIGILAVYARMKRPSRPQRTRPFRHLSFPSNRVDVGPGKTPKRGAA